MCVLETWPPGGHRLKGRRLPQAATTAQDSPLEYGWQERSLRAGGRPPNLEGRTALKKAADKPLSSGTQLQAGSHAPGSRKRRSEERGGGACPAPRRPRARPALPAGASDWPAPFPALIGRVGEAEESRAQRRVWGRVQTRVWRRQGL